MFTAPHTHLMMRTFTKNFRLNVFTESHNESTPFVFITGNHVKRFIAQIEEINLEDNSSSSFLLSIEQDGNSCPFVI